MKIEELEVLEKAATPGPWDCMGDFIYAPRNPDKPLSYYDNCRKIGSEFSDLEDDEFVQSFRNAAPALLRIAKAAKDYVAVPVHTRSDYWNGTRKISRRKLTEALADLEGDK